MRATTYDLVRIKENSPAEYWSYDHKRKNWTSLTEQFFCTQLPGYNNLNEQARTKARAKFIKNQNIPKSFSIPNQIPHTGGEMHKKHVSSVSTLLELCTLFEDKIFGYLLLSDILCGFHTCALRQAAPGFTPALAISTSSPDVTVLLEDLFQILLPEQGWKIKRGQLKQKSVLDYRTNMTGFPRRIQDFSEAKLKVKGTKKLHFPLRYADAAAMIIGANASQIREASPYLQEAAIFFINSETGDFAPTKLKPSNGYAYAPEVMEHFFQQEKSLPRVLHWWWGDALDDEDTWARQIVQEARASFGKPDSRYIRVELDPKRLRNAIRYRVFLSFLDAVEETGFMTAEELTPYRQGAKEVFDPDPPESLATRHAEDPDVFLEIMRALVKDPPAPIVAEGERFIQRDRPLAAWRSIRGERHLIFLEADWAKTYAKAVRSIKEVDTSFFQREHWCRDIQKILCKQGLIKAASSGYRYRYGLLNNGTRDETYVLAIPAQLLEV